MFRLTGSIPMGLYECPAPYKRIITTEVFKQLVANDRLVYHKDTSIDLQKVKEKYFEAFEMLGGREKISIINGSRSEKEISNDIWKEISKLVGSDSHHLENTIK